MSLHAESPAEGVVIYATGSPILVDVEESLRRARVRVVAAVKNVPGESFFSDESVVILAADVSPGLTRYPFVVALFTPANRQRASREAERCGFRTPFNLVDPTSVVPRELQAGPGLYVNAGCSLGAASRFGDHVFVNRGVSLGHHACLGAFVSIGPGAVIAGQVTIGKGTLVGAGAVVLPQVVIGENAVVGAGAVVTRPVPNHTLVVGNPARVVRSNIAGYGGLSVE